MAGLVVVEAELRFDTMTVDYLAFGPDFEEAGTGEAAGEYTCELTKHESGGQVRWTKTWRRITHPSGNLGPAITFPE
jgi:hypothetical protein